MKITAFISNLSKGGAQGVFITIVNYIHENMNCEVEVVVENLNDPVNQKFLNPNIKIVDLKVDSAKKLFVPLRKYISNNNLELALVFSPEMSVGLVLVRKYTRIEFPIYSRCMNTLSIEYANAGTFFRRYISHFLIKLFYHKVDKIVAQSVGMKEDLLQNYHFRDNAVTVINNALAIRYEEELKNKEYLNKEKIILYVGRLENQKGLKMLLEAFTKINEPEYSLILVGSGTLKDDLKSESIKLNIEHQVNFIEYTSDIITYYKRAKVTVLTSIYEGFPNVLIESLACGTPVVAYDLPSGPKEIITDDNGYLVPYLHVDEFAQYLSKAINKVWNPEKVQSTAYRYKRDVILKQYEAWLSAGR